MLTSLLILESKVDIQETLSNRKISLVQPETVRNLIYDLKEPKHFYYYRDFLSSSVISLLFFYISLVSPLYVTPLTILVSAFFQFRCVAFIHEIFHQQKLTTFRHIWHLFTGIPFLMPFTLYYPIHFGHHSAKLYGTKEDGEYENFKANLSTGLIKISIINLLAPMGLLIRFCILSPLAFSIPGFREKIIPKTMHMTVKMPYTVPLYKDPFKIENAFIEVLCCVYGWSLISLSIIYTFKILFCWAAIIFTLTIFNSIRFICSTHLYIEQNHGRDFNGQLNDSINIGGNSLLTTIFCPAGLRYHALHHIAPYLPYHALPIAHERLIQNLPPNSEYHLATVKSLFEGFQKVKNATSKIKHLNQTPNHTIAQDLNQ